MTFAALGHQLFLPYLHNAAGPWRNSLFNADNYLYHNRKSPKKTADKSGGSSHKAELVLPVTDAVLSRQLSVYAIICLHKCH